MRPEINHVSFLDEFAVEGTNGQLSLTLVPAWGSNLISLRHVQKQVEVLRTPSSRDEYRRNSFLYGMPILFPPNRIEDGRFTFNNRSYQFNINEAVLHNHEHGLVYGEAWDLLDEAITDNTLSVTTLFDSIDHPAAQAQFPHRFQIQMKYTLHGYTLTVAATIINRDEACFPWGFGYHTSFRLPMEGGNTEACDVNINVDKQCALNQRFLPIGECIAGPLVEKLQQGIPVHRHAFDHLFSAAASGENVAILRDRQAKLQVAYRCDESFKFWVVYNDDGQQGYLCPEPYTWIINAPNVPLPPTVTGLRVLEPGESVSLACSIDISDLS